MPEQDILRAVHGAPHAVAADADSAFSAALDPNGTTELTIAATVNDIQVDE